VNDQNNINNSFDQNNDKANESFDYEANEISRLVKAEYKKIDKEELLIRKDLMTFLKYFVLVKQQLENFC